jgi:O-antigen ligase
MATPIATALSRNVAFPLLLVVALLLIVAVALQSEGTTKIIDVARWIFRFRLDAPAFALALAIVLFALVSLLWSPAPGRGFGALAGASTAALVSGYCCLLVARHINTPNWLRWGLPTAIVGGCLIIISEVNFGSPIRSALAASTDVFRLNRAAVCVALMVPLLFLVRGSPKRLIANLAVSALVVVAVFASDSESAKLAAIVVIATLLVATFVSSTWLVLWCGALVLAMHVFAPFIALAMYTLIPPDAVASLSLALSGHPYHFIRLEIWWAYALQVLENPIVGHGLQASYSALASYSGSDETAIRGLAFIHPHNFAIQVWYELGIVGVALSSAIIFLSLRSVFLLPSDQRKIAVAFVTGLLSVAFVGHGAWQHWWWAAIGIVAILFSSMNLNRSMRQVH